MNFNPFPIFNGERIQLRPANKTDLADILFSRSDPEMNKYIHREIVPKTLDEAQVFLDKVTNWAKDSVSIYWVICLKDNPKMMGSICLWNFSEDEKTGELGYGLHPDFQRKGYMTEATKIVLDYGFTNLNLANIVAYTHHKNKASINLLLKHKFQLQADKKDPGNSNNVIFDLVSSNWL